jgi:hypothetical protein
MAGVILTLASLIAKPGVSVPAAYRVTGLTAEHIRAVYSLPRDST